MLRGWTHSIGRIAALMGVLSLLLIGGPLGFGTTVGQADADASRHHPAASGQISVGLSNLDLTGTSMPDCPHQHRQACCVIAGCSALSMNLIAASPASMAWLGAADFVGRGTTVPDGVAAMPVTPPPRRTA